MSKITAFVQPPEKNGAVDVYADGEYVMTLAEDTVIEAGLRIGSVLDPDALEKIERSREKIRVRAKAYSLLSYGDMSVRTMRDKLSRYDYDPSVVDDVVAMLEQNGYLDDERYAASLAKYLAETKCYGPRRISQELFVKGIDKNTADDAIYSLETDFYQTVKVHIPRGFDFSDRKAVSRLYGALVRRGFDYDVINSVLKEPDDF